VISPEFCLRRVHAITVSQPEATARLILEAAAARVRA
jgi:hypothetical protein